MYCLITGAAGGIGRALVHEFHSAGYKVIATDVVAQPAGLECFAFVQVDLKRSVNDETYAAEVFGRVRGLLERGKLKALVNNAAVQILGGVKGLTRQDWWDTLDVNLLAPFMWTQAFLSELEAAHGCVVNISSIHAKLTKKSFVAYATSKAALSGMTRSMAVDLEGRVRVNAIEPAAIETEMLKAGFAGKEDRYRELQGAHPQKRIGEPHEVAVLARMMADGGAAFLHGACIPISGGIHARLHDPD